METKEVKKEKKSRGIAIIVGILLLIIIIIVLWLLFNKKPVSYEVIFDSNGGTSVESLIVDEDGIVTKPEDPTREGFEFVGWYYNDELFDFDKPISGDIELEAKWSGTKKVSGVELSQTKVVLEINDELKLTAKVLPEDAKDQSLTWESSNPDVVSVDANGNIKALKEGTATITVKTTDGGYTAKAEITVSKEVVETTGITLSKTELKLNVNGTSKLTATVNPKDATNKTVTWSSSNTSVATVDSNGNVTAKGAGTATITAKTADGKHKDTCKVTVSTVAVTGITLNKTSLNLTINSSSKLTATVNPSNATNKNVTWSSSNTSAATVDANGNIRAVGVGTTTITVTTKDGNHKATCKVTVSTVAVTGVTLNRTSLNLTVNNSSKLTATVNPSNATNKNVTWSSSNSSVATVDSSGNVKAVGVGTATITVTTKDGNHKATCTVTVAEAPVNYTVILSPIVQEVTGAINQYSVTVTKNGSAFSNYIAIEYGAAIIKPHGTLAATEINKNLGEVTIALSSGKVKATVIYR